MTMLHIEKVVGEGRQSVYAYHYPSQYRHCGDYPIKIGAAKHDAIKRILASQSAMQEQPSVDLIINCKDAIYLESAIHSKMSNVRIKESFGDEWFMTNREDILAAWMECVAPISSDVGTQLRYYRRLNGLSQEDLATAAGVRQATISCIEKTGDGAISSLRQIAIEIGMELRLVARQ